MNLINKLTIGNNAGIPPNVTKLLSKYGDAPIKYIKINRTPVNSGITTALNMFSQGGNSFASEFKKLPYTDLYHLSLIFSTTIGRVSLEKNERLNMSERPVETEVLNVAYPQGLTIKQIYSNGLKLAGPDKFYKYNAMNNNCQNFILYLLQGSKLATPENVAFTKQDTLTLFQKDPRLRKISNTMTTIGQKVNILQQGGGITSSAPIAPTPIMPIQPNQPRPTNRELWNYIDSLQRIRRSNRTPQQNATVLI